MRNELDRWNMMKEMLAAPTHLGKWLEPYFDPESRRSTMPLIGESEFAIPACDLSEDSEKYNLRFDLPGVKKENIKVEMEENHLLISGERNERREGSGREGRGREEGKDGNHFVERTHGTFRREFTFPTAVEPAKVVATYENGVLELTVPKLEPKVPRRIPITDSRKVSLTDSKSESKEVNRGKVA